MKGHSSLGGETRNRRFVGGGRKYLELLSLVDPRPGSRPVHLPTLGTLHPLFGSLVVLCRRQKIGIRISDMTMLERSRVCISG